MPSLLQAVIQLVNKTLVDGQYEIERAQDKRGTLDIFLSITLGDGGKPIHADTRLAFTEKRHLKDN